MRSLGAGLISFLAISLTKHGGSVTRAQALRQVNKGGWRLLTCMPLAGSEVVATVAVVVGNALDYWIWHKICFAVSSIAECGSWRLGATTVANCRTGPPTSCEIRRQRSASSSGC